MNKTYAKKLAYTITNEQIKQMFDNAKNGIKDWKAVSSVNSGLSKGASWNILARKFDVNFKYHVLAKRNMIWEFGDYLPNELKEKKSAVKHKHDINVWHEEPIFK